MKSLLMGAVETLCLFEDLNYMRYILKNPTTGLESTLYLTPEEEEKHENFMENGEELDVLEKGPLPEWLVENYMKFGAVLEFITDRSQEGT